MKANFSSLIGITNKMQKYFNISLEFNHSNLRKTIEDTIENREKGYVCIVDANVLTIAQNNKTYCNILNQSIVNSCDGSSIAMLAGFVHKKKFRAWNGPDIFDYYIEKGFRQLLLGSNEETSNGIKDTLKRKGIDSSHISVLPLPYKGVNDFDYLEIAKKVYVSLGAPKQELFMDKLLPHISKGVMFGIGAAFNFYIGKIALPSVKVGALKFIWISRIFSEPKKQLSRIVPYIKLMPKLYWNEKKLLSRKNK